MLSLILRHSGCLSCGKTQKQKNSVKAQSLFTTLYLSLHYSKCAQLLCYWDLKLKKKHLKNLQSVYKNWHQIKLKDKVNLLLVFRLWVRWNGKPFWNSSQDLRHVPPKHTAPDWNQEQLLGTLQKEILAHKNRPSFKMYEVKFYTLNRSWNICLKRSKACNYKKVLSYAMGICEYGKRLMDVIMFSY